MTSKATKPLDISELKGKVDFGIITIREDEFRAVLKRFPKHDVVKKNRHYAISYLPTNKNSYYTLAMVSAIEEGNGQGQKVANDLIEDLDPDWLLLIGIGAGVPDYEFTLGDVVAAIRLQDFSISADLESRKPEYDNRGGPMHPAVTDILKFIPAIDDEIKEWNSEESIGLPRPLVQLASKNFYGEKEWQDDLKKKIAVHFGPDVPMRNPKFTTRSVASSDRLMKNTATLQDWLKSARKIGAVEMELAGVYLAAQRNYRQYPILAIRGISDIVGFKRDPAWTEYACHSAASFAHALLKTEFKPPRDSDFVRQRLREITFPIPNTNPPPLPMHEQDNKDSSSTPSISETTFKHLSNKPNETDLFSIVQAKKTISASASLEIYADWLYSVGHILSITPASQLTSALWTKGFSLLENFILELRMKSIDNNHPNITEHLGRVATSLAAINSTIMTRPGQNRSKSFFEEIRKVGNELIFVSRLLK